MAEQVMQWGIVVFVANGVVALLLCLLGVIAVRYEWSDEGVRDVWVTRIASVLAVNIAINVAAFLVVSFALIVVFTTGGGVYPGVWFWV